MKIPLACLADKQVPFVLFMIKHNEEASYIIDIATHHRSTEAV